MYIAFAMELTPMLYSLFFDRSFLYIYILLIALKASASPNGAYYDFLKVEIGEMLG